jgi:hypothetical protein
VGYIVGYALFRFERTIGILDGDVRRHARVFFRKDNLHYVTRRVYNSLAGKVSAERLSAQQLRLDLDRSYGIGFGVSGSPPTLSFWVI